MQIQLRLTRWRSNIESKIYNITFISATSCHPRFPHNISGCFAIFIAPAQAWWYDTRSCACHGIGWPNLRHAYGHVPATASDSTVSARKLSSNVTQTWRRCSSFKQTLFQEINLCRTSAGHQFGNQSGYKLVVLARAQGVKVGYPDASQYEVLSTFYVRDFACFHRRFVAKPRNTYALKMLFHNKAIKHATITNLYCIAAKQRI